MKKLGIVGCGKMGQALASSFVSGLTCGMLCCDVLQEALTCMKSCLGDRAEYTTDISDVCLQCDVVLVSVKPDHAREVVQALGKKGPSKLILSIVAGLKHSELIKMANGCEVVRIMPNTPALVGYGSMVILDKDLSDESRQLVEGLFSRAGYCHFIKNEAQMDGVTGLSGSGPALFAMLVEALSDAGVAQGLPRKLALDLARETMLGTAHLLTLQHPEILKENVMSPGGTTAAGVLAAEKAGFRYASAEFVRAASEKSRQMG